MMMFHSPGSPALQWRSTEPLFINSYRGVVLIPTIIDPMGLDPWTQVNSKNILRTLSRPLFPEQSKLLNQEQLESIQNRIRTYTAESGQFKGPSLLPACEVAVVNSRCRRMSKVTRACHVQTRGPTRSPLGGRKLLPHILT